MNNKITDTRAIHLLISNILLKSGKIIFYVFLNIFIWKETHDVQITAIFNMVYLTSHFISFVGFAPIIKKGKNQLLHAISLLGLSSIFLFLLIFGKDSINYIYFVGAGFGFFNGIYWINYLTVQFFVTNFTNRGNYAGLNKSGDGLSKMLIPSLVGTIITLNYGGYGYEGAFLLGIICFMLALFIGNIKIDTVGNTQFKFRKLYGKALTNKKVFTSLYTYSLTGFSFGNALVEVIMGIIIFSYVGEEGKLGYILSVISFLSIISLYIFGKFISYSHYKYAIAGFGTLYILFLLAFSQSDTFILVLLFSSFISVIGSFYSLPQKVISDNVLHEIKNYQEYRTEYMVLRECFLFIGWISAFIILYFLNSIESDTLKYLFYIMSVLVGIATYKLSHITLEEK